MKKIFILTFILIIIPFLIVSLFYKDDKEIEEIRLNYVSSIVVRVYRAEYDYIDNVMLEEYVVGVVSGEMPVSFDIEALKAQAVASRSYVLKKMIDNKDKEYDVVDSVSDQVYLDNDTLKSKWGDNYISYINKVRSAVNDTSLEYLEYDGEVILAMYFSTSNGYTEDYFNIFGKNIPYLVGVESFWDRDVSSVFNDSISISLEEFYNKLGLKYSKELEVDEVIRTSTSRVLSLSINGIDFKGVDLYTKLGLRSYDFDISLDGKDVIIDTSGYGHGVGMSQYGSYGMALSGYSYDEILSHYYTGVVLKKMEV